MTLGRPLLQRGGSYCYEHPVVELAGIEPAS